MVKVFKSVIVCNNNAIEQNGYSLDLNGLQYQNLDGALGVHFNFEPHDIIGVAYPFRTSTDLRAHVKIEIPDDRYETMFKNKPLFPAIAFHYDTVDVEGKKIKKATLTHLGLSVTPNADPEIKPILL